MPTVYVPGAANSYFPKHKYQAVPVYGNYHGVEDSKLHHFVGVAGTVQKAVTAYVLSPELLWWTFQQEAEDLVKVNGRFIGNEEERNRRINAAYAKLWLADNRFQWAGLAAFASKQVGCGMLHSRELSTRSNTDLQSAMVYAGSSSTELAAASVGPAAIGNGAAFMLGRLGFGNMHLFLDIYPLHRFFMERGIDDFENYLALRNNKKYSAHWEIDTELLPFAYPFIDIRKAFQAIGQGQLARSVEFLAAHEQLNILQKILYNDGRMQAALALNQFAWVRGFPSGLYEEVKLSLSAQCKAQSGFTTYFPRVREAKLWVADERMAFVRAAAASFDGLLKGRDRATVEQSLRTIAAGGGVH